MEIIVAPHEAGMRLDVLLREEAPEQSRSTIQKAIRSGCCWCDDQLIQDPSTKAKVGQRLVLELPRTVCQLEASTGELEILWRDDQLAVCAKPPGLTVHPCPSCQKETLVNRLISHFPELAAQGGERPGIVHRLDKDTSGLILIALTEQSRLRLTEAFSERQIKKEYLALVAGIAPETGICEEPVGRHPSLKTRMAVVAENHGGRTARTAWQRLWHNDRISLLRVAIATGRTHQIRVHMAHMGHPVIGDAVYAPKAVAAQAPRQMLHAWQIEFAHPFSNEKLHFCAPPPEDFFTAALANTRQLQKIVVTGNQGCGKSSFCRALASLGLPMISADEIVAEMYAHKSAATEWIRTHLGEEAIAPDNSVNKPELFRILQERPELKREFETAIHGLVLAEIEQFWQASRDRKAAVAEIPLYFESGYQNLMDPLVIGVSCPEEIRWRRIAENRHWDLAKIETLESWQWPEERKMAACNQVISNTGAPEDLEKAAVGFVHDMKKMDCLAVKALLAHLQELCGINPHLQPSANPDIKDAGSDPCG